ncbi:MAG: DUF488 domain-containing protein [Prevotella sp.]|nr:DUF488 domain-containing protein [Prevotella sp.]
MAINNRKKIALAILEKMGGYVSAICMQKFLFIYTRISGERIYDFVPYKYGCFSFQANQDLVSLSKNGYITSEQNEGMERGYRLNYEVNTMGVLDMFNVEIIDKLYNDFGQMSQDELVAYTYRKWPYSAINSVIKEKLLNKEDLARVQAQKDRYVRTDPMLFTIGYEGFTLESYLRQLISNDVHVLCDVRKNAFSMKYGFSKAILKKACEGMGIKYIHVSELGIESEHRQTLNTQHDYDALFEQYEQTTLRNNWKSLIEIREIISQYDRVCLTCFEKDPKKCHRTRIAQALMRLPNIDYKFNEILL